MFLAACTPTPEASEINSSVTAIAGSQNPSDISGRVIDINGLPIPAANVSTATDSAQSDDQGWFHLNPTGSPQWIKVTKAGYLSRTRAAQPGSPVLIRLSPDDGKTIVINFGGDTMFGRRFFDPNEDGDPSDGLLPVNPTILDHLNLLAPIQPLLESGDLTVVNFESALAEEPFFSQREPRPATFHPNKEFVYASSANAIHALKQAGVDIVDTGNNHIYDGLEDGLIYTLSALDQADMAHFGSGLTEESAWVPEIITLKGQRIAFIGCTTVWAPIPPITGNDISYVASDQHRKGGAARCVKDKLYFAVVDAKNKADLVVVMIHGGYEYDPFSSPNIANLTDIANLGGASLVINGHPHVTGGFTWDGGTLIGQSMGNFIFDQTIWPTFESYMLTVYVREGEVIRAFVEPLIIENYVARGITGKLADHVARGAAGRIPGPFIVESQGMEVDINDTASVLTKTIEFDGKSGTVIPIPEGQWLSDFQGDGNLLEGRDLLWIGNFENSVIGNDLESPHLWKQGSSSTIAMGTDYAYEGQMGIRLLRASSNIADAVTTNLHRIPVEPGSKLTIDGMYRGSPGAVILLQISWYPDTFGNSSSQIIEPLNVSDAETWLPFQFDVQVPEGILALGIFLRLSPPVTGTVTADFDNIHVIEWAAAGSPYSVLYNYLYLTGKGNLTFSQSVLPGGEDWLTISK